jgi:hypothetical protein
MARKRRSKDQLREIYALVERLREFVRLNYVTAARIGVRDSAVYSWLQGEYRPAKPETIAAFLNSLPTENGSGIAPTGYEYCEYKNTRTGAVSPSLAVARIDSPNYLAPFFSTLFVVSSQRRSFE